VGGKGGGEGVRKGGEMIQTYAYMNKRKKEKTRAFW
jgi:hypothetical protein